MAWRADRRSLALAWVGTSSRAISGWGGALRLFEGAILVDLHQKNLREILPPDGEWQITLIHGAMEQHVAGFTQ